MIRAPYQVVRKTPPPILSLDPVVAFQRISKLLNEAADLKSLYEHEFSVAIAAKIAEVDAEIARVRKIQIKGDKGDTIKGEKGEKGDTPALQAIVQAVLPHIKIPAPVKGEKGDTPIVDTGSIVKTVLKQIPVPQPVLPEKIDHAKVAAEVLDILKKGKKLKLEHIGDFTDGLEQTLRPIRSLAAGFRGGGDTVAAGTNVTISTVNGVKTINALGGGSATIYTETPSGLIDGANKTYTTAHPITTVIGLWLNGEFIHPADYTVSGAGFTMGTALAAAFATTSFTISYA